MPMRAVTVTSPDRELPVQLSTDALHEPGRLPFRVLAGPMASGSSVTRNPGVGDRLSALGMRTTVAIDMEAAT